MSRSGATRCLAGTAVLLWAGVILGPFVYLFATAWGATPPAELTDTILPLAIRSMALAAAIAGAAVVLGFIPAMLLGSSRRFSAWLLAAMIAPMLLPRYVMYYAWSLLLSPTAGLGQWLATRPAWAEFVGTTSSSIVLILWYWPLAALLLAAGWRNLDADMLRAARLDGSARRRFFGVTLPLLRRSIALAWGVCFVLVFSEFGAFHLAGLRTVGTEMAVLYEQTGSTAAVAIAGWPMMLAALAISLLIWRRIKPGSIQPPMEPPSAGRPWRWIYLLGLWGLSVAVPVGLLVAGAESISRFAHFLTLHGDELGWSLLPAATAAAAAMLLAAGMTALERLGRAGRIVSGVMCVTVLAAMFLPGSLVAAAILEMLVAMRAPWTISESWLIVSAGLMVRMGGVAVIVLRLIRSGADEHLDEMAHSDGATSAQTWRYVHLPRNWALPAGAMGLLTMFGLTEISATSVLLPAGLPNFAQRLLNQMHYARDQEVIVSCLVLIGAYLLLACGLGVGLWAIRRQATSMGLIVLCLAMTVGGCGDSREKPTDIREIKTFGRTGRGRGEFIYPRAITRDAQGLLYVVDKTGRIQIFNPDGSWVRQIQMPAIEQGKPTGLTIGPGGNLYVADTHYHRVVEFDKAGKIVRTIGCFGRGDGQFIFPTDIAFAPDGRIFVSEYGGNDRISIFTSDGRFLSSFASPGEGRGKLSRPSAMSVDAKKGVLYVVDSCNHRIARYDLAGKLLGYWGSVGTEAGRLRYPYDIALLPDGGLVVCEYGNNRLQWFGPDGKSRGTCGQAGRRPGQLAYPWGVVADGKCLYIIDSGNNRIQIWKRR